MRSASTSPSFYLYVLVGGLVVITPAFCCTWLIAVTGFINNPLPQVLRVTAAFGLLGGLVGSLGYCLRRSLALSTVYTITATFFGLILGLVLDDYVQYQMAQWGTSRIYNQSGALVLILPPGYMWVYTAIPCACIVISSVLIVLALISIETLGLRVWHRIGTNHHVHNGKKSTY